MAKLVITDVFDVINPTLAIVFDCPDSQINLSVDGKKAVIDGEPTKGWQIVGGYELTDSQIIEIRSRENLKPGHHLAMGTCGKDSLTDGHFFVKRDLEVEVNSKRLNDWVVTSSGVVGQSGSAMKNLFLDKDKVFTLEGTKLSYKGKTAVLPKFMVDSEHDVFSYKEEAVVVSYDGDYVYLWKDEEVYKWYTSLDVKKFYVDDYIVVATKEGIYWTDWGTFTSHLRISQNIENLWTRVDIPVLDKNVILSNKLSILWDNDKLVALTDVAKLCGYEENAMVWEAELFGGYISDVSLCGDYLLVNETWLINPLTLQRRRIQ